MIHYMGEYRKPFLWNMSVKGGTKLPNLKKILPPILAFIKNHFSEIIELIFQEELFTELKDTQGKPATTKSDVQDCK